MMTLSAPRRLQGTVSLTVALAALALTGCGGTGVNPGAATGATGLSVNGISGQMHGGQQPIAGATIQVYIANNTTLKGLSTAPAAATATTDSNGNFAITSSYSCPRGSFAYIVGTGGDAGGGTNPAIALMAGLGACPVTGASVNINEVSTVASVYALAPFMADYQHIGYAGSSLGISNAFAMISTLANTTLGMSPGLNAPANAVPTAEIDTLADILASCINSVVANVGNCSVLFGFTPPPGGGAAPTDTIGATLNIATNPTGVTGIFNRVPSTGAPFQPTLTQAPADWTMAVKLTGNNLSTPYGVAIDSSGNAWVTNESGSLLSLFSPTGSAITGVAVTTSGARGITIDGNGNVWVANTGANDVLEVTTGGALAATVSSGMATPFDVAADARGNIWVANFNGNNVLELDNSGNLQNTLTAGGVISLPRAVAVDPSGNVWICNSGAGTMTEYSKTAALINAGYSDNALQGPAAVATDSAGNAWVAGAGGPELSGFNAAGGVAGSAPVFSVLNQPAGVAVDGAGTIWVTNSTATGSVSEFQAATGTTVNAALGSLNAPVEIAVDRSGNLWTANSGDNSVSIFVGLAAPTTTPLVARTQ